jgi:hypothetical protein
MICRTESTETTVVEYDVQQLKKSLSQVLISVVIIAFIHIKWEIIQPLFIQCFMGPMQVLVIVGGVVLTGHVCSCTRTPWSRSTCLAKEEK